MYQWDILLMKNLPTNTVHDELWENDTQSKSAHYMDGSHSASTAHLYPTKVQSLTEVWTMMTTGHELLGYIEEKTLFVW